MSIHDLTKEHTDHERWPVAPSQILASKPPDSQIVRFSRFHLRHVSQSAAVVTYGDVCKETCKSPTPTTCKLECHSGAPFTDLHEDLPESLF